MKIILSALAVTLLSTSALAEDKSMTNPILRPMTLTDGTVQIIGAFVWGEEAGENRTDGSFGVGYGLTDDLTLGLGGINYRVLARSENGTGLELTTSVGFRGFHDSKEHGESIGYGMDLNGKYVMDENLALTFGVGYVIWDEDILENKNEVRYSVGLQANLAKDWTARASYTYRNLQDFNQNEAHQVNLSLNYTYSQQTDIGIFTAYSDFDALENGYVLEDNFDKTVGVYVSYRF